MNNHINFQSFPWYINSEWPWKTVKVTNTTWFGEVTW